MGSKEKIASTLRRELVRRFTMLLVVSFMTGGSVRQAHAQKPGPCGSPDIPGWKPGAKKLRRCAEDERDGKLYPRLRRSKFGTHSLEDGG